MQLRVDGTPGVMDAGFSLRVLTALADVARAVAPDDAELPLTGLELGSAIVQIDSPTIASAALIDSVGDALRHPHRLTRRLRQELRDAYADRSMFGVGGFGFEAGETTVPYDDATQRRVDQSLRRPTSWGSVTGEVRNVGRSGRGLAGRVHSEIDGIVVNFEAPIAFQDELKATLFSRASVSGQVEVDDDGVVRRIQIERIDSLGEFSRLTDLDLSDVAFDSDATQSALEELRGG